MGVGCSVFDRTLKTPLSDRLIYFGRRGILSEAESCSLVRSRLPVGPDNMVEAHPTIAGRHLPRYESTNAMPMRPERENCSRRVTV